MPEALSDFEGLWEIDRRIEDRRTGETLRLTGHVRMQPVDDGLLYDEQGQLVLADGQTVSAVRQYLWRQEGTRVVVAFPDGRFFHSFDPGNTAPDASHWCDPDSYDVRYDLSEWPFWQSVWKVKGPRKDYVMTTAFRPPG